MLSCLPPRDLIASSKRSKSGLGQNVNMESVVVRDLEIMHGKPVFRGTRVLVLTLFEYLEGGETLGAFLEGFPTVSCEDALSAIREARELLLRNEGTLDDGIV